MSEEANNVSSLFPSESIKIIGESIGISTISDEVAKEVAEDITFRLKCLIQDSTKFTNHAKRKKLVTSDIDSILKLKNIEPLYGINPKEHIPFRFASGGGRELHFIEDKEIELQEFICSQALRLPLHITIKPHWLAIDGVQPSIPENPPPASKEIQKKEAVDPASKLTLQAKTRDKRHIHGRGMKSIETVKVKQLATHELSAEQQLYYKEITEACVGSDEPRRGEALHSLTYDPGLHQMVPRLCTFIAEGVRVNVVQKNLALLIYLMRMAKALLDNQTLYLEKYLHELVPSVLTCIVSRQLCLKPDLDNHWALRDFAARLISQLCKNYNTSTNGLQTRITRVFSRCLNTEKTPLSTIYGAIAGLSELGPEVGKVFILPKLRSLSDKIEQCMESSAAFDKNAASHIKNLLIKTIAPVLKMIRKPPDNVNEYSNDYGFLGPQLQVAVSKARQTPTTTVPSLPTATPIRAVTPTTTRIIQPGVAVTGVGQRAVVVSKSQTTISQPPVGQKLIIMTSRPSTPSQVSTSESLCGVMKSGVVNTNPSGTLTAVAVSSGQLTPTSLQGLTGNQKYVVVSASQPQIKQEIKEEPDLSQGLDLL